MEENRAHDKHFLLGLSTIVIMSALTSISHNIITACNIVPGPQTQEWIHSTTAFMMTKQILVLVPAQSKTNSAGPFFPPQKHSVSL